nr:HD domain-containing phosphohydrolase [Peribacillus asahii]
MEKCGADLFSLKYKQSLCLHHTRPFLYHLPWLLKTLKNGKGYPTGLKGRQIPLVARIVAVADTFDAMSSKRVYRNELNLEYILNEIQKNKGTQFDPEIVNVFLSLFEQRTKKDIMK